MTAKKVIKAGAWVLLLALLIALGCASPNTPGSDNVEVTGVILRIISIIAEDGSTGDTETDVVSLCCDAACTTSEPGIFDVSMQVILLAEAPGKGTTEATKITITSYTVEYFSSEPGAVSLPTERVVTQTLVLTPGTSSAFTLLLMSVETKAEFVLRGGDWTKVPTYEARVTFYGVNDYGYVVKVQGSTYLELGNWDGDFC